MSRSGEPTATSRRVAAAAATYDVLVRFLRVALRTLAVLGLVIALGAYLVGPAAGAVQIRAALDRGIRALRPARVAEALAAGGDHLARLQRDGVGFGLRLEAAGSLVGVTMPTKSSERWIHDGDNIKAALRLPTITIAENAGQEGEVIANAVQKLKGNFGYNA